MSSYEEPAEIRGYRKKYLLVYDYLTTCIDQSKFTLDNRLPSETFLCRKFQVSRETVRTAKALLEKEKRIYSVRGSGTFFDRSSALSRKVVGEGGKSRIAFITQGFDSNTSRNLIKGIRSVLNEDAADLKIFRTDNKLCNERLCLESCSTGFDGIIVDGVKASIMNPNLDCYQKIDRRNIRLLFFNNYYINTPYHKVIIDDAGCADALVRRLKGRGHHHIAGIFMYDNYQGQEKYNGFMRSLIKYRAVFRDDYVKWCVSEECRDFQAFARNLWRFLRKIPQATAIVCCNYMLLNQLLEIFRRKGVRVPEDYSVVCFDYSGPDWETTPVTASIHPGADMGRLVGERILKMVEDRDYRKKDYSHVFPPRIHEGRSIARLKEEGDGSLP